MEAGEAGLSPVFPVAEHSQKSSPECGSPQQLALCGSRASTHFALLLASVRRGGVCGPPPLPDVHHRVVLHLQRQGRPSTKPLNRSREALGLTEVNQEQCWSQKVHQCAI